jgi:REP element-mobilizing transposase RayT
MARGACARQRGFDMARALRIDLEGLTYHVWANGVNSLPVFRTPDNRDYALQLLRDEVEVSGWCCLAYVVMTTHYHVLLRLQKPTLSSGFKRFNMRYAQYYNKQNRRRGHVFDGRFQSKIVEGVFGELETARYLAQNPTRANICEGEAEYPWSSYGALVGDFTPDRIVDVAAALAPLGGTTRAYRKYVEEPDVRRRWGQVWARPRTKLTTARPYKIDAAAAR